MRTWFLLPILAFVILGFSRDGKKEYPQNYFRSPVKHAIRLSGTFGELRPNHLHAGIDIKAYKGGIGEPILAIAEGYISRIKVQAGGYGNVLYINHPNGYTSVYAHLDKFTKEVQDYVRKHQYKNQTFEVELFPPANKFSFTQGQQIGKLGVSGRSFGPHLHFEIRDTRTEKPINPLLFGIKISDKVAPRMHEIKIYHLNDKRETSATQTVALTKTSKGYRVKGDTLNIPAWRAGFALKTYDQMNGASNWNGVYSIAMFKDDILIYDFEMESFAFSESRFINAHLDYAEQVAKKSYFNRCYQLPGNQLSIYNEQVEKGVVKLHKNKASQIKMLVRDADGNESSLIFWVKRADVQPVEGASYNYLLPYAEENIIENQSLRLYFPKGTFYENIYLEYSSAMEKSNAVYSSVHHIQNYKTPVHKYYDLAIRPIGLPEKLRSKAFIAYCQKDGSIENMGGYWKDGYLQTQARVLGDFYIMVDTKAPTITPIAFRSNMKGFSKMSFKIKDDIKTGGKAKDLEYRAMVDGKWILMEYDSKKDLITHRFDGSISSGSHQLKLVVRDNRGNETVLERKFTR